MVNRPIFPPKQSETPRNGEKKKKIQQETNGLNIKQTIVWPDWMIWKRE